MISVLLASLLLAADANPEVRVEGVAGDVRCSVAADAVPLGELLHLLARGTDREVEGLQAAGGRVPVTVELADRPFEQVVERILGTAQLRGRVTRDQIIVTDAVDTAEASREELEDAAQLAYLKALKSWPRHERAAAAEMTIASIHERRGNVEVARSHYDLLFQEHPDHELAPTALMRAATLLQAAGRWDEAWTELSALVNLERPHPYQVRARLELARTSLELGDPRQASFLLDSLDNAIPAETRPDLAKRLRMRARVLDGSGDPIGGLRLIDQADSLDGGGASTASPELRARFLASAERWDEAGRAWLAVAGTRTGPDAVRALREAARCALRAGDELAVLFIHARAEQIGHGDALDALQAEARRKIGLQTDDPASASAFEELDRAEQLLERGLAQSAHDALQPLYEVRERFDDAHRTRLALAMARAADALDALDEGLDALRQIVRTLRDVEHRRELYLLAGELLEEHGRYDEAIAAYEGRL